MAKISVVISDLREKMELLTEANKIVGRKANKSVSEARRHRKPNPFKRKFRWIR